MSGATPPGPPAGLLPVGCFDDQFGPWAGPTCRGGFDFTLFFEETILRVPVQALFLYLLPYRIIELIRMEKKVRPGVLRPVKLVGFVVCRFLFDGHADLVS
jgi:ATP-binding cassette subfamily C (CFTR/MRP) protein 1